MAIAKYTIQLYWNSSFEIICSTGDALFLSPNRSSCANAAFVTLETVTKPPALLPSSSPQKFASPVPKIVSVRPVTFWFARSVTVRKL